MNGSILEVEAQRARWERYRAVNRMVDITDEGFATGGLASRVRELDVRLLFLPADPLAAVVRFNREVVEWLQQECPPPTRGRVLTNALNPRPCNEALLVCELGGQSQCTGFFGIHHHGGLEAVASRFSHHTQQKERVVHLRAITTSVWRLALKQREATGKWTIPGPFEVTLAIRSTAGAHLGMLAVEESDFYPPLADAPPCEDPAILIRLEFDNFPDPEVLAEHFGERVDQSFGSLARRHVFRSGDRAGQLPLRL